MAFARVQAAPKATTDNGTSVAITFSATPTVGNGVVVPVIAWNGAFPALTTCVDNQGGSNSYSLAKSQTLGHPGVWIYYCSKLAAASGTFTITVSGGAGTYFIGTAVEFSGVGTGLTIDQTAGANGSTSAAPNSGNTANLTASNDLVVGAFSSDVGQASITVDVFSPTFAEDVEELNGAHAVGEADDRILSGGSGAPTNISWTMPTATNWSAAVVAFAGVSAAASARVTQDAAEILSKPTPNAVVTQDAVEIVSRPTPSAVLTQAVVEILGGSAPVATRLTQLLTEVWQGQTAQTDHTQELVELFNEQGATVRQTQELVEYFQATAATIRQTQELVEIFLTPGACVPSADFPQAIPPAGGSCSAGLLP